MHDDIFFPSDFGGPSDSLLTDFAHGGKNVSTLAPTYSLTRRFVLSRQHRADEETTVFPIASAVCVYYYLATHTVYVVLGTYLVHIRINVYLRLFVRL